VGKLSGCAVSDHFVKKKTNRTGTYILAQENTRGPGIYEGLDFHTRIHIGAQSFFKDLFRVRFHYRALSGDFGLAEQLYAKTADLAITHSLKAYYDGGDISKVDGLTISVNGSTDIRSAVNGKIGSAVSGNPYFVSGRTGAQMLIMGVVGRYSGTGFYGAGASFGIFGVATFGRALNLYDDGVRDTVDLLSGAISGVK